ncbi:MAG: MFS transporter [Anaerolineales bacterium]
MTTSNRVIRNYLLIAGMYTLSSSLIWGVNTLFLLDAGLDIFGVFIANAVFTGSMAVFEIPTGVLADTRGRRASFLLSLAVVMIGTLGYVAVAEVGGGLVGFAAMSVVLGLGFTFYSGAVEAWLVDALAATGFAGKLDQIFARSAAVSGAAMLVGTIGGGVLGSLNLSFPFVGRAILLAAVFAVAYITMHDIGFEPHKKTLRELPTEMASVARNSVQFGWQQREVRMLIVSGMVVSMFTAWGFYAWQPYFLELLGRDLPWVAGTIAALVALSMMAGNGVVEWFARYCGKRTTLLAWALGIQAAAAVGVGLVGNFYVAVGLYLIVTATYGVMTPVKQAYIHQVIPSGQRATVISFDSLVGSGGSMAGQGGLGYISQVRSIASGYVLGGLFSFLALPAIFALRRMGRPADVIVGDPGKQSACAAQGLPTVSGVSASAPAAVEVAA